MLFALSTRLDNEACDLALVDVVYEPSESFRAFHVFQENDHGQRRLGEARVTDQASRWHSAVRLRIRGGG